MTYIYDILLNFNKKLIEYFEWEDNDDIKYVKKIILFKTNTNTVKDIIENIVILDKNFTNNIPKYEINNIKEGNKLCLLTDGKISIGLLIKNNKVEYISRMLLDEEYETLLNSETLEETNINYKIIKKRINNNNTTLTRTELKKQKLLLEKLNTLYNNRMKDVLIYLYYEYTNKECQDIDYIYNYLVKSLTDFNDRHIELFNILLTSS